MCYLYIKHNIIIYMLTLYNFYRKKGNRIWNSFQYLNKHIRKNNVFSVKYFTTKITLLQLINYSINHLNKHMFIPKIPVLYEYIR